MVVATKKPPAAKRAGKISPLKVPSTGPCKITHSLNGRPQMEAGMSLAAFWETIAEMKTASAMWSPGKHKFVIEIDHRPGAPTKKA